MKKYGFGLADVWFAMKYFSALILMFLIGVAEFFLLIYSESIETFAVLVWLVLLPLSVFCLVQQITLFFNIHRKKESGLVLTPWHYVMTSVMVAILFVLTSQVRMHFFLHMSQRLTVFFVYVMPLLLAGWSIRQAFGFKKIAEEMHGTLLNYYHSGCSGVGYLANLSELSSVPPKSLDFLLSNSGWVQKDSFTDGNHHFGYSD